MYIRIRILFCGGTDNPHLHGMLASYTFLHLYPRTRKSYKPSSIITDIAVANSYIPMKVGPCHHGMARPRVADGGTASNMEGSCE